MLQPNGGDGPNSTGAEGQRKAAAVKFIAAMEKYLKMCLLYPPTHDACRKGFDILSNRLDACLALEESFRLLVEKEGLAHQGEMVTAGPSSNELLTAPLYRDGVEWVEFRRGIGADELFGFMETLARFRALPMDAEGDIVTALWERNDPNMGHGAREVSWSTEMMDDFHRQLADKIRFPDTGPNQLPGVSDMAPPGAPDAPGEDVSAGDGSLEEAAAVEAISRQDAMAGRMTDSAAMSAPAMDGRAAPLGEGPTGHERPATPETSPSMSGWVGDRTLWRLSDAERVRLREMVYEAENMEETADILDVLTIILREQGHSDASRRPAADDLNAILVFLKEEFCATLAHGQARLAFRMLKSLHGVKRAFQNVNPQALPLLDRFLKDISTPDMLVGLAPLWSRVDRLNPSQVRSFRENLLLLHPTAILAFGPMLLHFSSRKVQRLIMEIIVALAARDPEPLERLLTGGDENLVSRLVSFLAAVKDDRFAGMLHGALSHPSDRVRATALKIFLDKDPYAVQTFFHMIHDPSPRARRVIHGHLGRRRDTFAESLLLDYLELGDPGQGAPEHLLECYQSLGRCGSDHSVPFLEDVLFDHISPPTPGGDAALHRRGAAEALAGIGTPGAYKVLKSAGASLSLKTRSAARSVLNSGP